MNSATPPRRPKLTRTYEWNGADQLTAINYTGTTKRTEFTYDGRGRWVQIVEKTGSTVNATRRFLWDGGAIRLESDATGTVVKRFFAAGVQLVGGSAPGSYYYTRDHLGSIRELTDTSAKLHARYNYDPYGRRSKVSGDLDTDLGFGGLFEHAPSGLALALLRAYDPNVGRWVNRDPIREGGGLNLYATWRTTPSISPISRGSISAERTPGVPAVSTAPTATGRATTTPTSRARRSRRAATPTFRRAETSRRPTA